MSSTPPETRVLESSRISPPPQSVAESSWPLTFFDVIFLYLDPVERVFFYELPHPTSHFVEHFLPRLKTSLSLTLQHFYPLAGKIRRSLGSEDKYEIHYAEGDSVPFTVAELDEDFEELCGSHARDVNRLVPLTPQLPRSYGAQPLLALQVTVFPNRGIAIGIAVHHAVCDGTGSTHFMSSWASTCQLGGSTSVVPQPPVLDRTLISDPSGLYTIFYRTLSEFPQIAERPKASASPSDLVIATFTLGTDEIQKLKGLISRKSTNDDTSIHISTIVVVFAYVWVCLVKVRGIASDKIAHLAFPADCRGYLQPPLSPAYLGNCVGCCFVDVEVGDLLEEEDGFVTAAKAIGRVIKEFKDDAFRDAERWMEKFRSIFAEQPLTVAGSPKFRVYDFNFGWGRPKKVEIISIRNTGALAMSLAESKEGRGVEVGLALPKHEMDEFANCFYNGLKLSHP